MSSDTLSSSTPPGIERGKKYRFVVSSAEEAIATLRERLGADAKVISVKQVDGQGLSRFLSSPRLEIIATLPEQGALPEAVLIEEEPPASPAKPPAKPVAPARPSPQAAAKSAAARAVPTIPAPKGEDPARAELEAELEASPLARQSRQDAQPNPGASRRRAPNDVWTVLRNAGFDDALLSSFRYDDGPGKDRIDELSLPRALAEVNRRLRLEYQALKALPATGSIAFFGTPGVGKTTALCKRIANEVFMRRRSVEVLKLDSDTPNPDDALSLFCDVLGVSLHRDTPGEEEPREAETLYVDLPGLPVAERRQWEQLRSRLDELKVDTRVLVINGMYEAGLVSSAFDLGSTMGATHLVLTHMDEMLSAARLWPFVLRGGLCPLFASHGQNVTSDYTEDLLRLLLEKTFPSSLIS